MANWARPSFPLKNVPLLSNSQSPPNPPAPPPRTESAHPASGPSSDTTGRSQATEDHSHPRPMGGTSRAEIPTQTDTSRLRHSYTNTHPSTSSSGTGFSARESAPPEAGGNNGGNDDINMEEEDNSAGSHAEDSDPRIRTSVPGARRHKTAEEKLLHAVVRAFLTEKGLLFDKHLGRQKSSNRRANRGGEEGEESESGENASQIPTIPSFPLSADPKQVEDYVNFRSSRGPSAKDLRLAWLKSMSHPWNKAAVRVLVREFQVYAKMKKLPDLVTLLGQNVLTADADVIALLNKIAPIDIVIRDKLKATRQVLQTQVCKYHNLSDQNLTETEVLGLFAKATIDSRVAARRSERRKLRFIRRYDTIQEKLLVLTDERERAIWVEIEIVFAHFQAGDMSDDETESESTPLRPKQVRRVRRHWLSPEVTKLFHFIDGHYTRQTINGTLKRGQAPLTRNLISNKVETQSNPRQNLPVNFYHTQLSPEAVKALRPKDIMELPKIPEDWGGDQPMEED